MERLHDSSYPGNGFHSIFFTYCMYEIAMLYAGTTADKKVKETQRLWGLGVRAYPGRLPAWVLIHLPRATTMAIPYTPIMSCPGFTVMNLDDIAANSPTWSMERIFGGKMRETLWKEGVNGFEIPDEVFWKVIKGFLAQFSFVKSCLFYASVDLSRLNVGGNSHASMTRELDGVVAIMLDGMIYILMVYEWKSYFTWGKLIENIGKKYRVMDANQNFFDLTFCVGVMDRPPTKEELSIIELLVLAFAAKGVKLSLFFATPDSYELQYALSRRDKVSKKKKIMKRDLYESKKRKTYPNEACHDFSARFKGALYDVYIRNPTSCGVILSRYQLARTTRLELYMIKGFRSAVDHVCALMDLSELCLFASNVNAWMATFKAELKHTNTSGKKGNWIVRKFKRMLEELRGANTVQEEYRCVSKFVSEVVSVFARKVLCRPYERTPNRTSR